MSNTTTTYIPLNQPNKQAYDAIRNNRMQQGLIGIQPLKDKATGELAPTSLYAELIVEHYDGMLSKGYHIDQNFYKACQEIVELKNKGVSDKVIEQRYRATLLANAE